MSAGERAGTEIYLDWNATTPPLPEVTAAMNEAAERHWANPSSVHGAGRRARGRVEDAREAVAGLVGVEARDVVLTSGGTEANNLALQGVVGLAASRIDHPSVTRVAEHLEARGTPVAWLPVTRDGAVDIEGVGPALARLPPQSTVALAAVNHETGVRQPVREVARHVWSAGARLHVDAVQAIGKLAPSQYNCADSLALAAHKIRGPKGIGALVWRTGPPFRPVLLGGAQERGLRPGTQDAVACVGFRIAAEHARTTPTRYEELAVERDRLETMLLRRGQRNGDPLRRVPHVSNVSIDGWVGDELVAALDLEGVCVSSGSACSAGTAEPSPVVTEMVGEGRARRAIRFSLGETTTSDQIDRVLAVLGRLFDNAER